MPPHPHNFSCSSKRMPVVQETRLPHLCFFMVKWWTFYRNELIAMYLFIYFYFVLKVMLHFLLTSSLLFTLVAEMWSNIFPQFQSILFFCNNWVFPLWVMNKPNYAPCKIDKTEFQANLAQHLNWFVTCKNFSFKWIRLTQRIVYSGLHHATSDI